MVFFAYVKLFQDKHPHGHEPLHLCSDHHRYFQLELSVRYERAHAQGLPTSTSGQTFKCSRYPRPYVTTYRVWHLVVSTCAGKIRTPTQV